ncbi:MAG: hypothetical protein WCK67_08250 [bacterium]
MTTIDAILAVTQNPYLLAVKRKNKSAFYSIDKMAEAQASESPQKIKQSDKSQDINFQELIKELKLYMPNQRLRILMMMKPDQIIELLQTLKPDKLALGLKFFNKKKLLSFVLALPKEDLMKMLLKIFSKEEVLAMMPVKEFKKFFDSTKISQDMFIKVFKNLPPNLLAQILEGITGVAAGNKSKDELIQQLGNFNKALLVEGIMGLGKKQIMAVASEFIKMDESLFGEFSKGAFFRPIAIMPKNEIAGIMDVLKPEQLIGMLSELPQNMMAQLATLADPAALTESLLKDPKLLASLAG